MASDLLLPILTVLLQFVLAEQTGCSSQYLVSKTPNAADYDNAHLSYITCEVDQGSRV